MKTPEQVALESLNKIPSPYDANDELGHECLGRWVWEHQDVLRKALADKQWRGGMIEEAETIRECLNKNLFSCKICGGTVDLSKAESPSMNFGTRGRK